MSAIFGERLRYPQEAGPDVQLMVWGDEFYARRETISGYTGVYDQKLGLYCYAQLAQGWFVTTRVPISKPPPPEIPPYLNQWPLVRGRRFAVRSRVCHPPSPADDPNLEFTFGPADGLLPGRQVSRGRVRGLTILVQFPDQTSPAPTSPVEALLT